MAARPITINRYLTLDECFRVFLRDTEEEFRTRDLSRSFWCGSNGRRGYRKNVKRWIDSKPPAWGWAEYGTRTIHVYVADDCPMDRAVALIAHEIGHLMKPRPKDKVMEERKAEKYATVAKTAFDMAQKILEKRFDGEF